MNSMLFKALEATMPDLRAYGTAYLQLVSNGPGKGVTITAVPYLAVQVNRERKDLIARAEKDRGAL